MLTGDNQGSAMAVARQLGIDDVRAEVLPGDKAAVVQELKAAGAVVAMVGDGIERRARAGCGRRSAFAMAAGTDVAMETAGITLMRGDPRLVADSLDVSRRTYSKIKQRPLLGIRVQRARHPAGGAWPAEPCRRRRRDGVQQRERRRQRADAASLARRGRHAASTCGRKASPCDRVREAR